MANLQKKTKAELIMLCNERGSEIQRLNKEVEKIQEQFDFTDKELAEARKKYHALEADFKGSEDSYNTKIKELNIKYTEELQALRNKVSERDKTIAMQGELYKDLKDSYDQLVYENGVNRSNVGKYKLTTIAFIILFIIALICACI